MSYIARVDLENALGVQIIKAVYDDNGDGLAESGPLAACCAAATAECNSFLRGMDEDITLPLTAVPDEVKFAALDFGIAYTMRRRPDVVRAMGEESWTTFRDSAIEKMKRYVDAMQQLPGAVTVDVGGPEVSSDEQRYPAATWSAGWENTDG